MDRGNECRLCGKIVGGNAGSMAKHQRTWQCAARRPSKRDDAERAKRRRQEQEGEPVDFPQPLGCDVDGTATGIHPIPGEESSEEENQIVPSPVPRPHDPSHAVRKRMRLRFSEILRLNEIRDEAALVSNRAIVSAEVADDHYDAEDEELDSGEQDACSQEISPGTEEKAFSAERESEIGFEEAARVLRDHLQLLFSPPQGAGLPAAKRKEVFQIVQLALSAGKAFPSLTVLDLFQDRGGESASGTMTSVDTQFKKHMASLTHEDGWVCQDFHVIGGSATCFWNTRAIDSLATKVGRMIDIVDSRSRWDGKRFGHPTSGAFMKEFSEMLQFQRRAFGDWRPEEDLPILLTYFSDATLLANKGSMTAHPVVVGMGNVPAKSYPDTFVTVGYLDPKLAFEGGLHDDDTAQVKRALVARQVGAMMEQFKRCSFLGKEVHGSDGKEYRMFTGLFDCAIDNPEVSLLLGHKSGYCGSCHWKTEFGPDLRRTESISRKVLNDIRCKERKVGAKALTDRYARHPQPSGLWGFNGSCSLDNLPEYLPPSLAEAVRASIRPLTTTFMDVHAVVSTERMHEIDVGITVYVRDTAFALLRSTFSEREIEDLNDALWNCLTIESRWQGLVHPPKKRETAVLQGYLGGIARVEASEHRTMLQVMVPLCCRSLGYNHPVTRTYALFVKFYAVRECRLTMSTSYSKERLQESERLLKLAVDRLRRHQPIDDRTGEQKPLETPKIHA